MHACVPLSFSLSFTLPQNKYLANALEGHSAPHSRYICLREMRREREVLEALLYHMNIIRDPFLQLNCLPSFLSSS